MENKMFSRKISQLIITFAFFYSAVVCHFKAIETYKDENNNWLSPSEVFSDDGKNFFKIENKSEKITVGSSESMSKSKKNVIDPELIINNFGADSVRLFILSDSPPDRDIMWSDSGIEGSYKFLQNYNYFFYIPEF